MNLHRLWRSRAVLILVLLACLVAVIGLINPSFLELASINNMVDSSLILVLIGLGEMFVILTRGIDVSVGAITGLSAVIVGTTLNLGVPLPAAIVLGLLTGLVAGMVNGLGITVLRIPPIIMTLATLGAYRGLMQIITGGSWIETIPRSIKSMTELNLLSVSGFAWAVLVVAVLTARLLRLRPARWLYAVGDNEQGAFMAGIPVRATQFAAYSLSGLFAGAAATIFLAQIGFVPMSTGSGQELRAIAAAVLGGVNLSGGVGTPFGVVVGGVFLTVIDSVLVYLQLPAFWNDAVAGAILLAVVFIDFRFRRAVGERQRLMRAQARSGIGGPAGEGAGLAAGGAR